MVRTLPRPTAGSSPWETSRRAARRQTRSSPVSLAPCPRPRSSPSATTPTRTGAPTTSPPAMSRAGAPSRAARARFPATTTTARATQPATSPTSVQRPGTPPRATTPTTSGCGTWWRQQQLHRGRWLRSRLPTEQWLRADLWAHRGHACTLAYMHHHRFSSGDHGPQGEVDALWRALYAARADIVLSGHDHAYERFAPQTLTAPRSPTGSGSSWWAPAGPACAPSAASSRTASTASPPPRGAAPLPRRPRLLLDVPEHRRRRHGLRLFACATP